MLTKNNTPLQIEGIQHSTLKSQHCLLLLLFICSTTLVSAQFKVTFVLSSSATHSTDAVYMAGNFNGWNPADSNYRFISSDKNAVLEKHLAEGIYEFKMTRGGWDKVECMDKGGDMGNRIVKLSSDTTILMSVAAWRDDYPAGPREHSVSSNVSVMDSAFFMPQLNSKRRIWIYLPENYYTSRQRYPVLYMHDGQNLFDNYTSGFGEWGIDECLDSLIAKGKPASIVIGIDNGKERFNEYNPYDYEKFGKGKGDAYVDFIVNTLKPYVDKRFRTLPNKENTLIAGSSMGGLISFYAMMKYSETFGRGGIFSPPFWTAPAIRELTDSLAAKQKGKLFFYMGGLEGGTYIQDMKDVEERMGRLSDAVLFSVIDDEASHNEAAWRKWFPEFYQWIMAEGYGYFIPTDR